MKLIESKAEYIPQEEGLEGIYKQIELAGRTAYKSEDKMVDAISIDTTSLPENITIEDIPNYKDNQQQCIEYLCNHNIKYQVISSAKDFVDRMIKSKHGAALEHGTVYLKVEDAYEDNKPKDIFPSGKAVSTEMYPWLNTPYCKINKIPSKEYSNVYDAYITTNLRYIWEKELGDLQGIHNEFLIHMCPPTEFHEKRYTMRFTCSRAIAQELTRHRKFSFIMESQRYINYSKERHGGEITFIIPQYLSELKEGRYINNNGDWYSDLEHADPTDIIMKDSETHNKWNSMLHCFSMAEQEYQYLLKIGATPQQARDVLPNATKTELVMTGFSSDWRFLMDLRLFEKTGKVHPDMKNLMQKAQKAMQEAGIWEDIMNKPSKFE